MSFVKQLAGQTAIYGLSSILSRVLHYILLTVYLTRVFAPVTYGIYTDLYAYTALLLIIFTFRMETAFFRFGAEPAQKDLAFSEAMVFIAIISIALMSILIGFRDHIASALTYTGKGRYVVYFACILALDALAAIPFAKIRLDERPIRFATIKILNILVTLVLVFLFLEGFPWLIDHGWNWLSNYYHEDLRLDLVFIANLIASAVVWILLLPDMWTIKWKRSLGFRKKMLWYVIPLVIVGLAGVFNQSFAVPLLKYLLPGSNAENLQTAGLYAAAAKLALLMNLFTQAFNYAAEPFFFKSAASQRAQEIYAEVAQAFALVASIFLLGILLYLDLLVLILGPDYRESLHIVPILLVAFWFLGMYYNISIWYKILDKTHFGALISVGGSIITLLVVSAYISVYTDVAMAGATLACYSFMCIAGYVIGRRYYPIPYPIVKIMGYLIMALLIYVLSKAIADGVQNLTTKLALNTILLLAYIIAVYRFDRQTIQHWFARS
ncbi:MAG: polysaccharide biosynthesis protein [Saprospiraceae bacterium]|nr:polysaccharide biosynthesis protein [Saprospiraceae bacterium]